MARTTADKVEILLGFNYATRSAPSLTPYIESATNIVDRLIVDATAESITISAVTAELIERWLSCYFYCQMDPLYKQKGTDRASGSFVRTEDDYKKVALALDPSGLLEGILDPKLRASGAWSGKTDTEALDYDRRMG